MFDQVATYVLSKVFDPNQLGVKSVVVEPALDWTRGTDSAILAWTRRVIKTGTAHGAAAERNVADLLTSSHFQVNDRFDPCALLLNHPFSGAGALDGYRSLSVELFGRHDLEPEMPVPMLPGMPVRVADSHVHAGLAYDRRELLRSLAEPRRLRDPAESREDIRVVMLAEAVRFGLWVLQSWCVEENAPFESIGATQLFPDCCVKALKGEFWSDVVRAIDSQSLVDDWAAQLKGTPGAYLHRDLHELRSDLAASDLPGVITDPHSLLVGVNDVRQLFPRGLDTSSEPGISQHNRYLFVIQTVRAAIRLFEPLSCRVGEGFAFFQDRALAASHLRRSLFPPHKGRGGMSQARNEAERQCQARSILSALRRYPPDFPCIGLELRREIDVQHSVQDATEEVLHSISKGWATAATVLSNDTDVTMGPLRFCSPISFQRPRSEWLADDYGRGPRWSVERTNEWTLRDWPPQPNDPRLALPWQQLAYSAITAKGIAEARKAFDGAAICGDGALLFDHAVGSLDVSGSELGHATWMYVSAIRWLRSQGVGLAYTAHAGESFARAFTGLRTIGELFLGGDGDGPDRIGHALALDRRLRYNVSRQHDASRPADRPHDYNDMLMDLCYLRHVFVTSRERHDRDIAQCDRLIRDLTAPSESAHAAPCAPRLWSRVFVRLHNPEVVGAVVAELGDLETRSDTFRKPQGYAPKYSEEANGGRSPHDLVLNCILPTTADPRLVYECQVITQQLILGRITMDVALRPAFLVGPQDPAVSRDYEMKAREIVAYLHCHEETVASHLRRLIKRQRVIIETCPSSNFAIAGHTDFGDHPFWSFADEPGIAVSLSSDDPLVFGGFSHHDIGLMTDTWSNDANSLARILRKLQRHRLPFGCAAAGPVSSNTAQAVAQRAETALAVVSQRS
jgi:hypothetical protein